MAFLTDKLSSRAVLWILFFIFILMAWAILFRLSLNMGLDIWGRPDQMAQTMRRMDPRMDMYMPMARFGPLLGMWAIMMIAMMLPTLVPSLRAYEDLIHSASGTRAGWVGLVAGYATAWLIFAFLITGAQLALLFGGVIDMLGIARDPRLAAILLIIVGAYQFTAWKDVCHGVCHRPMMYFLGHWRTGFWGGMRMGFGLGGFCVGCCWGFMALGFVGGMMNLAWMGLATFYMILEKLPQIAHWVGKPVGGLLIALGVWLVWTGGPLIG